ncbi:DUF5700 domain-containing putative Zn-dependent protease [Taibaiella koreensis]|uniref:DUF5700 domain-containing putative Zn-dependent protease n=1 Tax=Taibaiella koreensis TaxID=1268548 RepID=UPI0013C2EAE0|nr:DUF5700 domain-containing putative Zn-dependent protease [Taibaiella koreensis]
MKKIILLLALSWLATRSMAQSIDDRSCWEYFNITARLKAGDSLSKEEWNGFLQNEAIRVYMKDQGVDSAYFERYRRIMEIVYMPANEAKLQRQLKDPEQYWWTYIVNEYKVNEDKMKAYLEWIDKSKTDYLDTCYHYSYGMLPVQAHGRVPGLRFSIIPLHNDAHVENGWIIYTLMAAYFNDANKLGVLGGHELHHILRPRFLFETEAEDKVVVTVLQRILNEGSADLIDKPYMGSRSGLLEFQKGYPESFLEEGVPVLKHIDSLLAQDKVDKGALKVNQLINTSNTSGHIPGYYMMQVIERNGYRKELIAHISNPFYYIYLYDRASKKDRQGAYILSPATLKYIGSLDKKYAAKGKIYSLAEQLK